MQRDEAESFSGSERFELRARLGAGAFGVVYEAYDRERAAVVALKVLRAPRPDGIARFKREFRALADLTHPNLVALHELACEGGRWFFTMERVHGVTLLDHARGESSRGSLRVLQPGDAISPLGRSVAGPLPDAASPYFAPARVPPRSVDPARLRRSIGQLASGLAALHAAGKLHRDVKPSNALVTDEGRVVLLDFGLATDLAEDRAAGDIAGTVAYMAPEQVTGAALTEAADAYAVGAILFEALSGGLPFEGPAWQIASAKIERAAPPTRAAAPDAPEDLCALCDELLARDPALRPTADAIVRRVARGDEPHRASPVSVTFVGRAPELDALDAALGALTRGQGGVAWVHGPSGVGKTALVRQVLDRARARGLTVLAARCYEQERLPYKTMDGIVDALVERWSRLDARAYSGWLPTDIAALVRLFPALFSLAGVAECGRLVMEGEPHEIRRRAFEATRELLARLAGDERVVLFIDDLQWGDLDGARLLAHALRAPAPRVLLIGTFRDDDRDAEPLGVLRAALADATVVDVALGELSGEETSALAASMLAGTGPLPADALQAVVRESGGLPFLVGELVRLASGPGGHEALARSSDPDRRETNVQRVVRARLTGLPDDARALLRVIALAGQPTPRAVVRDASTVADEPTAFAALRGAGLVRATAGGSLVETYHDRIRESVRAEVPAEVARSIHGALALALETGAGVEPERLAHHFEAAGDPVRASVHAERAGDRANAAFAFERAAALYRRALDLDAGVGSEKAARLLERRADALADAGRSAEAANLFHDASSASGGDAALTLQRKAAEHWLRAGNIERGVGAADTVLRTLGVRLPRTGFGRLVWLGVHRAWLTLRGLGARLRPESACDPRALLRYDMCWGMSVALSRGDAVLSFVAHVRSLELALALGEPSRLQRSLFNEATFVLFFRGEAAAAPLRARLMELAPQTGAVEALAAVPIFDAFAHYFRGRWRDAADRLAQAERYLVEECRGVAWEIGSVRTYRLAALHFLGDLPTLARRVDEVLADAVARGDAYLEATLRVTFAFYGHLVRDDAPRARNEIALGLERWGVPGLTIPLYWALYAEVEVALYEGDGARAHATAEDLARRFGSTVHARIGYMRALTAFLRARAALAFMDRDGTASLDRFAAAQARAMRRVDIPWAEPASSLLLAALASKRGETAASLQLLEGAAAAFEREGFALYAAVTQRAIGLGAGNAARFETAEAWMRSAGVVRPDRLARVVAPGLITAAARPDTASIGSSPSSPLG